MKRRNLFETAITLSLGALAGCALPGNASREAKTPFDVPATYVPIVGSDMNFRYAGFTELPATTLRTHAR